MKQIFDNYKFGKFDLKSCIIRSRGEGQDSSWQAWKPHKFWPVKTRSGRRCWSSGHLCSWCVIHGRIRGTGCLNEKDPAERPDLHRLKKGRRIIWCDSPCFFSGVDGIRTHAPVKANGFQDRLVMTASIPLRINTTIDFIGGRAVCQSISGGQAEKARKKRICSYLFL